MVDNLDEAQERLLSPQLTGRHRLSRNRTDLIAAIDVEGGELDDSFAGSSGFLGRAMKLDIDL